MRAHGRRLLEGLAEDAGQRLAGEGDAGDVPVLKIGADAVSTRVLGLWERALDAIEAGNLGAIAREIDWVIKYQLIERYRAEHDVSLSAPEVAQIDLAYRRRSVFQMVRPERRQGVHASRRRTSHVATARATEV